jgi:stage II sporulation protein R
MKRSFNLSSPSAQRTAAFVTCAAILISAIAFFAFFHAPGFAREESIYTSVLRLHIRANSDSAEDQEIKLAVRDALLPFTASLFASCEDMEDAARVAKDEADMIIGHIDSTLCELGADYRASAHIGKEEFPERCYGGEVYPAGEYTALIVELGEGAGENWWCVLFPSLCLPPAAQGDESIEAGLTPEQYGEIASPSFEAGEDRVSAEPSEPQYRLKFRFLELLFELFSE